MTQNKIKTYISTGTIIVFYEQKTKLALLLFKINVYEATLHVKKPHLQYYAYVKNLFNDTYKLNEKVYILKPICNNSN